jgi:V-type H+-transporting ATPase subunit G
MLFKTIECCHLLKESLYFIFSSILRRLKGYSELFINKIMADHNTPRNDKKTSQGPNRSLSPVHPVVVSSLHPYITTSTRRSSMRSTSGSSSRARQPSNGHSSIQMEPGLQALLAAERRATEMIATARAKRNELMRQSNRESQAEIEAFRRKRQAQYKLKLHEATQLEQFQAKLDVKTRNLLKQMDENVKKQRKSLINYITHCVIDEIPVRPHPNAKRVIF